MLGFDPGISSLPSDHHLFRVLKTPIYNTQHQTENFSDKNREQTQRGINEAVSPVEQGLALALVTRTVVDIE